MAHLWGHGVVHATVLSRNESRFLLSMNIPQLPTEPSCPSRRAPMVLERENEATSSLGRQPSVPAVAPADPQC